jgi:peptidoglycan/LPS O-acetylase OafA/YrhL
MRITHVPGLDGLRGLAVIGVLLFHSNQVLRGGYLGVDLFFVLSGFLITSILIEEHKRAGTINLKAFWIRRARRLLPALLALMPAVALYARTLAKPSELQSLRRDALATLGYVANWRAVFVKRSYWEMFAAPSPLEHTWSLAIEEQFYVVWPLVVVGLFFAGQRRGERALLVGSLVLALASCLAMLVLYDGGDTTRVYLGTDTRGAAILFGAALAASGLTRVRLEGARMWTLDVVGVGAAVVFGAAWVLLDGKSPLLYRGGFWVTQLCALVLIACAVCAPGGVVAWALSLRPLRAMGLISYGVYLWHWPVYVVLTDVRTHLSGAPLFALRIAVTLVIAAVSYRYLERPIREHGIVWGRPLVVVPTAVALVLVVVLVSTRVGAADNPTATFKPTVPSLPKPGRERQATMDILPPASELPPGTLRVLVLGDSVALSLGAMMYWMQTWDDASVAHRAVGDCSILAGHVEVHSMSGIKHGNGDCARAWLADVTEVRPDVTAILLGGAYFSTMKVGTPSHPWVSVCDRAWLDTYAERLTALLGDIAPFTKRRVVVLTAYPGSQWQTPTIDDDVDCYNGMLRDVATRVGVEVLDVNVYLCPNRQCTLVSHGEPVRPDGLHFDGPGAEEAAHWVLHELHHQEPLRGVGSQARPQSGDTSVRTFLTPSAAPITTSVIPAPSTKSGSGL